MYFFVQFLSIYEYICPSFPPQSFFASALLFQNLFLEENTVSCWASSSCPCCWAGLPALCCQIPVNDPTPVTWPSAPFCLFWEYPSCHFFFFNSLSRMLGVITFMHICLTSMFLSSGPKELVGSVQIPNSRVFQSLPFIWIVYQIILLLSMAQVMFTSKHVYKQLLHVKYSGFP